MLDWHPYDSSCSCGPCKVRTLALQERPERVTADPIGELMARTAHITAPPLAEMLRARARGEIKMFPELAVANLAGYQQIVIEAVGETPASRSASDEDNRRYLRQQLSLVADLRAKLRLERAKALNLRETIEHTHALLAVGDAAEAEAALLNALDSFEDERVDEALMSAGEAVLRGN